MEEIQSFTGSVRSLFLHILLACSIRRQFVSAVIEIHQCIREFNVHLYLVYIFWPSFSFRFLFFFLNIIFFLIFFLFSCYFLFGVHPICSFSARNNQLTYSYGLAEAINHCTESCAIQDYPFISSDYY